MSPVKNILTLWWETMEKNQIKNQLMKKISPNPDRKLRRKTDDCWERDIEEKVVNKKSPDLGRVLRRKLMSYDWNLKSQKSLARHKTWKSKGRSFDEMVGLEITYNHVQLHTMWLKISNVEVI